LIGEYVVDQEAEREAEHLLETAHPELLVIKTPEGKRQIPLQDILLLEQRFQEEKAAVEKVSFECGRQSGYEAGVEKGQEEARKVVSSLSGLLTDVTRQRHELLADAKENILELILKISQRLTFSAASIDPELTKSIISGAVEQLLDKSKIKVKVSPNHLAELEQYIDRFRGSDTAIKEFIMEADPRVRVGGCFIETPAGDIDARLESMYDIIRQTILDGEDSPE
jgi:flagellar assembly protein FliH